MKLILVNASLILDLLLMNLLTFSSIHFSYLFPMLTLTTIVFLGNFYSHANRKNYYGLTIIVAIVYDSLVINNLLLTLLLFFCVAYLNVQLKKVLVSNLFNTLLRVVISIILYDVLFHLLLVISLYQNFDLSRLFSKISHSLLINIFYAILMFLVLKPKKA